MNIYRLSNILKKPTQEKGYYLVSLTNNLQLPTLLSKDFLSLNENHNGFFVIQQNEQPFSAHSEYNYLYKLNLKNETITHINDITELKQYGIPDEDIEKIKTIKYYGYEHEQLFFNILQKINAPIINCNIAFSKQYVKRTYINKNNITGITYLLSKHDFEMDKNQPQIIKSIDQNKTIFNILKKFMTKSGLNIQPKDYPLFEQFKTNNPITVFRGMSWSPQNLHKLKNFSSQNLYSGSKVKAKFNSASSWTTNEYIANDFAYNKDNTIKMVVKATLQPENIIIDTRTLDPETLKKLYISNQKEVIVKPGDYSCEIIHIGNMLEPNENTENADTKNKKEVPLEKFNINQIFNMQTAFKNFFTIYKNNNSNLAVTYGSTITYEHKNKLIFGDWAIEEPTIIIKGRYLQFIAHIQYQNEKFTITMQKWKPNYNNLTLPFKSTEDLINYIRNYSELESQINKLAFNQN